MRLSVTWLGRIIILSRLQNHDFRFPTFEILCLQYWSEINASFFFFSFQSFSFSAPLPLCLVAVQSSKQLSEYSSVSGRSAAVVKSTKRSVPLPWVSMNFLKISLFYCLIVRHKCFHYPTSDNKSPLVFLFDWIFGTYVVYFVKLSSGFDCF